MKKPLHPLTMWLAVIAIAVAVVKADNVYLALGSVGAMISVVLIRRDGSPWNESFWWALRIAIAILVIRAIVGIVIGVPIPGETLFRLPILDIPSWMPGIRIGGAVTKERLAASMHEGVIIAAIISLFGAASSLTSPHKLLRVLPVFIYEVGITLVIATTVFPQLTQSVKRIRNAQKIRGVEKITIASIAMPLLEEALSRSLQLAESMDSRGYGVSKKRSRYRPSPWTVRDSVWVGSALALSIAAVAL